MFYKAGLSLANQRICQPYGDDQRIGLNLYRIIEPQTWSKVVNRVSGANFGNIYCGSKIMGYRKMSLPKGHSWKSYTKLLLSTLPEELAGHYKKKFIKFMVYWNKKGCPVKDGFEEMTSLAYGTHAALIKRGIQPNSQEYFRQIDSRLRQAFPDYDWQDNGDTYGRDASVTANQPSTVVAPSARSNGAKPRKIRLTSTQLSLAKRLGLTPEQYARELAKETS